MAAQLRTRTLCSWTLKVATTGDVCVEGMLLDDGKFWHTTAIRRARRPDLLETFSGSLYLLDGPIDRSASHKLGYPRAVVDAFEGGFPENWQEVIDGLMEKINARQNVNVSVWYENVTANAAPASAFRRRDSIPLHVAVDRLARKKKLGADDATAAPPPMLPPSRIPKAAPKPVLRPLENRPVLLAQPHNAHWKGTPHLSGPIHRRSPRNQPIVALELSSASSTDADAADTPKKKAHSQKKKTPLSRMAVVALDSAASPQRSTPRRSARHSLPQSPAPLPEPAISGEVVDLVTTDASSNPTEICNAAPELQTVLAESAPSSLAETGTTPKVAPAHTSATKTRTPMEVRPSPRRTPRRSPRASLPTQLIEEGIEIVKEVVETTSAVEDTQDVPREESPKIDSSTGTLAEAVPEPATQPPIQRTEPPTEPTTETQPPPTTAKEVVAVELSLSPEKQDYTEFVAEAGESELRRGCRVLRRWSVKPSMDGDVCVEGLLEDGKVWHTSSIRSSPHPRVVLTGTSSRYFLEGPMAAEDEAAFLRGSLWKAFAGGFPKHWKELLYDQVVSALRSRNFAATRWYEDVRQKKMSDVMAAMTGGVGAHEAEADEDPMPIVEMPPSGDEREESVPPPSFRSPAALPPPKSKTARKTPEVAAVPLHKWCLILHKDSVVCVEGFMPGNKKPWGTSAIAMAHAADVVETGSGSRYKLIGPLNLERTVSHGKFPEELAMQFVKGFRPKWKKLISQHHLNITAARKRENPNYQVPQESRFIDNSMRPNASVVSVRPNASYRHGREASVGASSTGSRAKSGVARSTAGRSPSPHMSVASAAGAFKAPAVPGRRSRSGRVLKTPLASWSGERILYNAQGEPVSVAAAVTATGRGDQAAELSRTMDLPLQPNVQKERRLSSPRKSKPKKRRVIVESDEEDEEDFSKPCRPTKKSRKADASKARKLAARSPSPPPPRKSPPVRWSAKDLQRLQVGLSAIKPAWDDMDAWRKLGLSFGRTGVGLLAPEKIRAKAQDVFGYDLRLQNDADQDELRRQAAAAQLSGIRRQPGSAAADDEARRYADASARNTSANSTQDVFNASILPHINPAVLQLQSLAELDESDLSDAVTPPAHLKRANRVERRFFPQPLRPSDGGATPSNSDSDTPRGPARRQRLAAIRRAAPASLNASTALEATASNAATRRQMIAQARKVEEQLREARRADESDTASDYEDNVD